MSATPPREGAPPDWDALAQQWLLLWQDGLSDLSRNQDLATLMGQILAPWLDASAGAASQFAPFLAMMGNTGTRDDLQDQIDALRKQIYELTRAQSGSVDDDD